MTSRIMLFIACALWLLGVQAVEADKAKAEGDKGKAVFKAKCAMCHGPDGKGSPAMAKMYKLDISALALVGKATRDKKDEDLSAVILKGKGKMPAYANLKDEVKALVAFIRGLAAPAKKEETKPKAADQVR